MGCVVGDSHPAQLEPMGWEHAGARVVPKRYRVDVAVMVGGEGVLPRPLLGLREAVSAIASLRRRAVWIGQRSQTSSEAFAGVEVGSGVHSGANNRVWLCCSQTAGHDTS